MKNLFNAYGLLVIGLLVIVLVTGIGLITQRQAQAQFKPAATPTPEPSQRQVSHELKQEDLMPKFVPVPDGDIVDDALAYAKVLVPYLQAHGYKGGTHAQQVGLFMRLRWVAEGAGYSQSDATGFAGLVGKQLEPAGLPGFVF